MQHDKGKKIFFIVLVVLLLLLIISFIIYNTASYHPVGMIINDIDENDIEDLPAIMSDNMKAKMTVFVEEIAENYLKVSTIEGNVYYLNYSNNNEQFVKGQEIVVFYNNEKIIETTPPVIQDIGKIEIK